MHANRKNSFSLDYQQLNTVAPSRGKQVPWFAYSAFLTLYALYFSLWPEQPLPGEVFAANVLLIAVCCFPITLWRGRGGRTIPMFELICLAYGVQFGLVGQMLPNSIVILSRRQLFREETLLHATLLAALGIAGLIVGYEIARRISLIRDIPPMDLPLDPARGRFYMAAAPVLGAGIFFFQSFSGGVSQQFGALVGLLSGQLYLAIVLLAYAFYNPLRKTRLITLLFWFALLVGVALGLNTGFLERAAVPLVLVVIVRWHQTRKLPLASIASLLMVLVLFNSVKGVYRSQAWYGENGGQSGIGLWLSLISQSATELASGDGEAQQEAGDTFLKRFDSLHRFAWVIQKTPLDVPHYGGETYGYFLYGWIPRFVWPDKPSASTGAAYRIDVDYQLITPDRIGMTNIGIGFLPEAFANFGAGGIFFVMGLQGVFFAALQRLLDGPNSQGGRAIYLAVMVFFLNGIASSTVTLFGALLQIVLANGLILRCFSTDWRVRVQKKPCRTSASKSALSRPFSS